MKVTEEINLLENEIMAISVDENGEGYFHGDKVKVTGKKDEATYSFPICEFQFTEGHYKGETIWQPID